MVHVLLVDDAKANTELFARSVTDSLGYEVHYETRVAAVTPELINSRRFDVAIVDLSFPAEEQSNGADALLVVRAASPTTKLVVLTHGDQSVADLLRDVWDVFPLATVMSKGLSLQEQLGTIARVVASGSAPIDPVIQVHLPSNRSPWRTLDGFGRLVQHAGHAKLWKALIEVGHEPSYQELATRTGLAVNSVKNYRSQLVNELQLHGLDEPSMRDMHAFARRCRPFLMPHIVRRLTT